MEWGDEKIKGVTVKTQREPVNIYGTKEARKLKDSRVDCWWKQ